MAEQTSTELAERIEDRDTKKDRVHLMVEGHQRQFERNLVLPDGTPMIHPEKFVRLAITVIRTTPGLEKASDVSLLGALMTCSQLGLEPGGPLGQAYIVPFEVKGQTEATLIVGYQGFIDLMYRSDRVAGVAARAVYSHDVFDYEYGTNEYVRHRPKLDDRGDLIAVYGIGELVTGAKPFEVMSKAEVDRHRAVSRGNQSPHSPWTKHYEAMARKTAIRQLFKWMPSSLQWQAALTADGRAFREIPYTLEEVEDAVIVDVDGEEQ